MTFLPQLRHAMAAIAEKKGDFALFGVFMRADAPGRWDLVVAAPWLEVGQLKAVNELVELLEDQLGERDVRQFAQIVTLKSSSPEIRAELSNLNVTGSEQRFYNTNLFGADVEEAVILRAKPAHTTSVPRASDRVAATERRRRATNKKNGRPARG